MAYTPTEWETGDTITAALLNKMENGIAAGGGYDLVLSVPHNDLIAANVTVESGSILACEQKIADGEPVNAILVVTEDWSYTPSGSNAPTLTCLAKLTYWHCPYCYMSFTATEGYGLNSTGFRINVYNVAYDPDDGSIVDINNPYMTQ